MKLKVLGITGVFSHNKESNKKSAHAQYANLAANKAIPSPAPPFDQRSGNATALDESKTGTRNFWFRFDSARASEIVLEMNQFQQPMRFNRLFAGFQSSPEVSIPGAFSAFDMLAIEEQHATCCKCHKGRNGFLKVHYLWRVLL